MERYRGDGSWPKAVVQPLPRGEELPPVEPLCQGRSVLNILLRDRWQHAFVLRQALPSALRCSHKVTPKIPAQKIVKAPKSL